ncbi:hypothetical protein [Nonomuraea sp. NEAU-A123]|uniref:hypothetical protein n=1 Tax=Nonomuraea sp. NEAU-A123 TaxID=2839649 RepID=UPI001BE47865|nr:hypothetical protein [Nonomuraea sp. NEAU-A123]MBT2234383.1 hypothetical protein [Nonomuraea sp. NEAU-A123]
MSSHDPFDDLTAELTALADFLDVPNPPPDDVAATVRARLEPTPATPEASRRPPAQRRRRARWRIVTAIVLVVIAITAATPQGRAAVRAILHYASIELRLSDSTPRPVTTPTPLPGEHSVAPADLAKQVKFPIKTPTALGTPERATVSDNGRVASMFWPGGIRLDQFAGTPSPYFFKTLGPPWPEDVQVAGVTAWWLGGSHPLGYIKREDGTSVPLRQAEPTLIWQSGTTGYRLEGAGTKEHAAEIAASLR